MLHYTCDACGDPVGDRRYTVRLELTAAHDPAALTEADLDEDHLTTLDDLLGGHAEPAPLRRETLVYDLCVGCRDRFRKDPLGRDAGRRLEFSAN